MELLVCSCRFSLFGGGGFRIPHIAIFKKIFFFLHVQLFFFWLFWDLLLHGFLQLREGRAALQPQRRRPAEMASLVAGTGGFRVRLPALQRRAWVVVAHSPGCSTAWKPPGQGSWCALHWQLDSTHCATREVLYCHLELNCFLDTG